MFHTDVYYFLSEIKKGKNAAKDVMDYFARNYRWFSSISWEGENPHATEENPYVFISDNSKDGMPLEMYETFIAGISGRRNRHYSVTSGKEYTVRVGNRDIKMNTYVVSEDGRPVMEIGYKNHPFDVSLIGTNLVNFYTDYKLLTDAARLFRIHGLVPDKAPLSNKVLAELDEILANAESEVVSIN